MRKFLPVKFVLIVLSLVLWVPACRAQASLAGDWEGTLDANGTQVHLVWHVTAAADGTLSSTFDNKDEGVSGIKVKTMEYKDSKLTLTVDDQIDVNGSAVNVRGSFVGTVSADGNEITGTWTQTEPEQGPADIHLKRVAPAAAPAASPKDARP